MRYYCVSAVFDTLHTREAHVVSCVKVEKFNLKDIIKAVTKNLETRCSVGVSSMTITSLTRLTEEEFYENEAEFNNIEDNEL